MSLSQASVDFVHHGAKKELLCCSVQPGPLQVRPALRLRLIGGVWASDSASPLAQW